MNLFLTESGEIINLDNILIVRQTEMDHYSIVLQNITFNVSIGDYNRIKKLCEHVDHNKIYGESLEKLKTTDPDVFNVVKKQYASSIKKFKKEVKKKGKKK